MKPKESNEILAARYVDGEMSADEGHSFQKRLAREPGLQASVHKVEEVRAWFRRSRHQPLIPPNPLFTGSVIAAARRLPTRDELLAQDIQEHDYESELVTYARRISLAAAVVFGLCLLLFGTLQVQPDAAQLVASPDRVRLEMERLDRAIRAETAGVEPRDR